MGRSTLRIVIIIVTTITALVHLALGAAGIAGGEAGPLNIAFVLNGIGYFVLLAGVFTAMVPVLSGNKGLAHYALIAFTAVTFVLYFVFNGFSHLGAAAIVSKLAELLLVITAFLHLNAAE